MNILAFDAAAAACSAALWHDGEIVAHQWQAIARGHAEALVPMIESVMAETSFEDLAAIAVTVGPGAFTGLRIALAVGRGLCLATGIRSVGVTNFDVTARMAIRSGIPDRTTLVVALETKRADFYLQAFDTAGTALAPGASVPPDALSEWLPASASRLAVAGDAAARLIALLPSRFDAVPVNGTALPDAAIIAALAAERLAEGAGDSAATLRPLYLRPPDAIPSRPARVSCV